MSKRFPHLLGTTDRPGISGRLDWASAGAGLPVNKTSAKAAAAMASAARARVPDGRDAQRLKRLFGPSDSGGGGATGVGDCCYQLGKAIYVPQFGLLWVYLVAMSWGGQRGAGAGVRGVKCPWGKKPSKASGLQGRFHWSRKQIRALVFWLGGPTFTTTVPYNHHTTKRAFPVTFTSRLRATGGQSRSACNKMTR